jgi:drug/metabolite transporter (DMT)-like permease
MNDLRGLLLALATLVLWSISPFFFTNMGKRVGPMATNLLRLALAFAVLGGLLLARIALGSSPAMPHAAAWLWLAVSGVLGLAVGDAYLYKAFVSVGPERTSQIQTLAPAATAAIAWVVLKEYLAFGQTAGMALILAGVFLATTSAARRKTAALAAEAAEGAGMPVEAMDAEAPRGGTPGKRPWAGTRAAVWSALFQAMGTVLAREAFRGQADLDPLLATLIRIGAGMVALWAYARARGPLGPVLGGWKDAKVLRLLAAGTFFGPVLGMLCYVSALKYAPAGIVTTVTFMAPLIIIPVGARLYGTRITTAAVWGTALSLAGVALLGLG